MTSKIRSAANIRSQHSNLKPLTDGEFDAKYARCRRTGKTAKDHKSGAWKSRFNNRTRRIRRTSSNKLGAQDNRSVEFWLGTDA